MDWYIEALQSYADFSGRSRRKEYWMFTLVNTIVSMIVIMIIGALGLLFDMSQNAITSLVGLYDVAIFLPMTAVAVRRMHDTDHSGWWILVPFVNLIFAVTEGDSGDNRFGPDPKGGTSLREMFPHAQSSDRTI